MQRFNPLTPPEDGLPPAEVRITELTVEPWPDQRRVKVSVSVTPFLERPNVNAAIQDSQGHEVASITIVETIDFHMLFTMHIRADDPAGHYTLTASLTYPELEVVHQRMVTFELS